MSSPTLAAIAADLAATGLLVFPCRADKGPACRHGCKDATSDPNKALRLFASAKDAASIGLATGPPSGLAVLDVDPLGLPWLRMQMSRNRLPQTRIHRTPRGGFHFLYRNPDPPLRNSASKIAPGIDIRGVGGYVIVPPSAGYSVVDEAPPAPFPKWIIATLGAVDEAKARRTIEAAGRGERSADPLARFVRQAPTGERNNRLFWAAARAAETGLGTAIIAEAALAAGLPAPEISATIKSAVRTARRQ